MQELFTLAQNGNEQALSTLINQALNNKDITVQCYRYDTCLYVVLVSAEAPEPSYCIKLISNELNHLRTKLLKTVQIYGRQNNQGDHIWTQTLELEEISDSWSSFAQTWFSKGSKQPQAKATKRTTNLSLLLLSSLSLFLLSTWGLVVKSQPNIVIDNTPNTETTVDVQNLFNEKNNPFVNSTFPDPSASNNKPNTSAEKEQEPTSKSEKSTKQSETKSSSDEQPKLAETSNTSAEKDNKSASKSEKSTKQSETKPSSDEQPKLTETTDTSAKKDNKSASKSEEPAKQSEAKPSKDKSTKKKKSHKKNKLNKKSSKSTPKVKAKSHEPSKSKTQSLTTKSDSKSSSQDTSDATLDKKASTSKQTTQPSKAAPDKLSVTPKPTTEPSKKEKSTVPATSTPASPASQTKPQTSTKENPADKSDQNQKSPDDLPAADKSSKPNYSWTSPTEEKSDKNLEPQPPVPSNTPKADTTPTPQTTSQPWLPKKQPEKGAGNDAPKSQPTKTPSTKQKQDTTSPANSKPGSISKPQASKNDGYITIKAVGDIVPGTNFPNNRLPDKNKIFEKVKKSLDGADILFGNFESTFTNSSQAAKDMSRPMVFAFRTPPAFVNVFKKTGFDVLSVANNHSLDFSQVGFTDTMKNIESAGMKPVGKKNEIVYKKVKNIPVAFIGFSFLDVHNSLNNLEAAKALVLEAKQNAKIVVISVHGGAEGTDAMRVKNKQENFYGENRGNMVLFARTMIDNGADLVLGHGGTLSERWNYIKEK